LDQTLINHQTLGKSALEGEEVANYTKNINIVRHVMQDLNEKFKLEINLRRRNCLRGRRSATGRL
jgi:hypothetical protein